MKQRDPASYDAERISGAAQPRPLHAPSTLCAAEGFQAARQPR